MTALITIPIKGGPNQKSRLACRLDGKSREHICARMSHHVLNKAEAVAGSTNIVVLSPDPALAQGYTWQKDEGFGLNAELVRLRRFYLERPFIVLSADLPFLEEAEINALVHIVEAGEFVIAADRHGHGTNAIGIPVERDFAFSFGKDSLVRHKAATASDAKVLKFKGLGFDIDTPADLDTAVREGFGNLSESCSPS
jgi:2-phospho-L-lactate guanylyltransferase